MKKTRFILLLCMIVVFTVAIALLVGCNVDGINYDYDYIVTFDYNVDGLRVPTNCKPQYLGVKEGDRLIAPGANEQFKDYTINNFYNEGWYTAAYDANGNVIKNEDGSVMLAVKWNFESDVVRGDMTLYANFRKNPIFTIKVEQGDDIKVSMLPGEVLGRPEYDEEPSIKDYTFIDYYTDNTYTTKFTFPYVFTEEDNECYALLLKGKWDIVKSTSDFRTALSLNRNMFFEVPSGVLDFERFSYLDTYFNKGYSGQIYGNGCVLKNISISTSHKRPYKDSYSFFGDIGKDAFIKDLTIENLTFTMDVGGFNKPEIPIALFASKIEDGARFENFKFTNCTLNCIGESSYNYELHGYYASSSTAYDCFDLAELTVMQNGVIVEVN